MRACAGLFTPWSGQAQQRRRHKPSRWRRRVLQGDRAPTRLEQRVGLVQHLGGEEQHEQLAAPAVRGNQGTGIALCPQQSASEVPAGAAAAAHQAGRRGAAGGAARAPGRLTRACRLAAAGLPRRSAGRRESSQPGSAGSSACGGTYSGAAMAAAWEAGHADAGCCHSTPRGAVTRNHSLAGGGRFSAHRSAQRPASCKIPRPPTGWHREPARNQPQHPHATSPIVRTAGLPPPGAACSAPAGRAAGKTCPQPWAGPRCEGQARAGWEARRQRERREVGARQPGHRHCTGKGHIPGGGGGLLRARAWCRGAARRRG